MPRWIDARTDGEEEEITPGAYLELRRDQSTPQYERLRLLGPTNLLPIYDQPMDCCVPTHKVFWSGILTKLTPTRCMSGTGNTPAEGQWHS